jgi:hypothetical protein
MATLRWIIERIRSLPVIATGRGRGGAHLFVVAGQVDLVHVGGSVAQRLRGRKGSRGLEEFETAVGRQSQCHPMAGDELWRSWR